MRTIALSLLSLAVMVGTLGVTPVHADTYHDHIHFDHGHTHDGHVIHRGSIEGFDVLEYTVFAHANEKMVINLKSTNQNNYFNIKAPGAQEAYFKGETFGDQYSGITPAEGTYTIQVYMLPHAAQEHQSARYTLDVLVKTPY